MRSPRLLLFSLALFALIGCNASPSASSRGAAVQPAPTVSVLDPASLPDDVTIPLTRRYNYLFVAAHLNGRPAGQMLFDTGSTLTVVDTGLANRLQLPVAGEGRTTGIAGREDFEFRSADSLAIAGVGIDHRRLAALSMRRLLGGTGRQSGSSGGGLSLGGLVGFTAFAGQPFTLDFPNNALTVHRRDAFTPPATAKRYDLVNYRGLPSIVAELAGGQEVLLILDTGANNAVSLPSHVADWPRILASRTAGAGAASGVGGTIQTQEGWLKHINLFDLRLSGVPVTFEPQPPGLSSPRYTVGRIGNQVLSAFTLTFHLQNRAIYIQFEPEDGDD